MGLLKWISDHSYETRRPGDNALLGIFKLGPKNNDWPSRFVFCSTEMMLYESDITRLQEQFVELNSNLEVERRRNR